jgi:hypothetical protein
MSTGGTGHAGDVQQAAGVESMWPPIAPSVAMLIKQDVAYPSATKLQVP